MTTDRDNGGPEQALHYCAQLAQRVIGDLVDAGLVPESKRSEAIDFCVEKLFAQLSTPDAASSKDMN